MKDNEDGDKDKDMWGRGRQLQMMMRGGPATATTNKQGEKGYSSLQLVVSNVGGMIVIRVKIVDK